MNQSSTSSLSKKQKGPSHAIACHPAQTPRSVGSTQHPRRSIGRSVRGQDVGSDAWAKMPRGYRLRHFAEILGFRARLPDLEGGGWVPRRWGLKAVAGF